MTGYCTGITLCNLPELFILFQLQEHNHPPLPLSNLFEITQFCLLHFNFAVSVFISSVKASFPPKWPIYIFTFQMQLQYDGAWKIPTINCPYSLFVSLLASFQRWSEWIDYTGWLHNLNTPQWCAWRTIHFLFEQVIHCWLGNLHLEAECLSLKIITITRHQFNVTKHKMLGFQQNIYSIQDW